ncbi:MAG: hypothetical protein KAH95_11070 [Spirochaetales bacterium]|nr:hypothetical protein [Spirochaetales bacterium]
MRTTITLDDNLLLTLKKKAVEYNIPFKTIVNQTLQRGLEVMETTPKLEQKYKTQGRPLKARPGYDLNKLGQVADEMEDEARFKGKV